MEEFKEIKGYEGLYMASTYGFIYKIRDGKPYKRIGIPRTDGGHNYTITKLFDKNKVRKDVCVHRIIAETFLPNPNNYPCVNHIDGNKHNNRVDNLEWVTYSDNTKKAYEIGAYDGCKVIPGHEQFSFLLGWSQVRQSDLQEVKDEILTSLNLKQKVSWYQRLYGNIEPKITEYWKIEEIFHKHGITQIWGVPQN